MLSTAFRGPGSSPDDGADSLERLLLQEIHREQHLKAHEQGIAANHGERLSIVLPGTPPGRH